KAGDPGIFARAAEEIAAVEAAGIGWEIVAGVTAAAAAAAETGLFLTERHAIRSITLTTGQTADGATPDWRCHAKPGNAVAFYMAVAKADAIAADLMAQEVPGSTAVEIVENASRETMRHISTTLAALGETVQREAVQNPAILLLRWPISAAHALAEDRGADADARSAESDSALEVPAHAHGEP
ncbi:MAG: SAM-dependent methyltransferase, partial [Pseudomonadota bacterium]